MEDWASGYVSEIEYTYGYYAELNPLRANIALLNNGIACPQVRTACELGFGQGVSLNAHAASTDIKWYGNDFNSAHVALAQQLSRAAATDTELSDQSFEDFCSRVDLPNFDYIGMHGVWSWISDKNRRILVDFIKQRLNPGGILYVSYNTLPGWSGFAPMRHLLSEYAHTSTTTKGLASRIDAALEFAERFLKTESSYANANLGLKDRMAEIKKQPRKYLAHEFFNRDWHPMHFATMAEWLEPAKLNYACSANYLEHIESLNFTKEQQEFMSEVSAGQLQQTIRDYMVNQQFRRDYWVKGVRKISQAEQHESLRALSVVLTTSRNEVNLKVNGPLGEATMTEEIYGPILDSLADFQPKTIDQLFESIAGKNIPFQQLIEALMVLGGTGQVSIVAKNEVLGHAVTRSQELNREILLKARSNEDFRYLVNPTIGGAIVQSRINQLFLLAIQQGMDEPSQWVEYTWDILSSQNQFLKKDEILLKTKEENIAELKSRAEKFKNETLPLLRTQQVIGSE